MLTLADARARARKLVDQAREGIDPAAGATERRAQARNTVAVIGEEYLERHVRRSMKSAAAAERRFRREILAAWGARQIQSLTKADVIRLVDGIADRGAGVMANRTLQQIKAFLNWCLKRSIVEVNVAAGVDLPHREKPRERVLEDGEIATIWQAFAEMGSPYGTLGKLLLLLGQREGETARARWSCIDLDRGTWRIPAADGKTGVERVVPLPHLAREILASLPRISGSDWVFPGRGDKVVSSFGRALARAHALSATSAWRWHDCRRSMRSGLGRVGVRPDIAERVVGHVVGKQVERIYDRYRYEGEMRQAVEAWAAELERIVAGEAPKVLALPRR